jgi:hypothetical protein
VAFTVASAFGAKGGAVSDTTTCTQWGSANQDRQIAYGRLYLREHGPIQGFEYSPAGVITAINDGCAVAYGDDVGDSTNVVQAISGNF